MSSCICEIGYGLISFAPSQGRSRDVSLKMNFWKIQRTVPCKCYIYTLYIYILIYIYTYTLNALIYKFILLGLGRPPKPKHPFSSLSLPRLFPQPSLISPVCSFPFSLGVCVLSILKAKDVVCCTHWLSIAELVKHLPFSGHSSVHFPALGAQSWCSSFISHISSGKPSISKCYKRKKCTLQVYASLIYIYAC